MAAKAAPAPKAGKARTLKLDETFYCSSKDLFECFTHEGRIRAFTQVRQLGAQVVMGAQGGGLRASHMRVASMHSH